MPKSKYQTLSGFIMAPFHMSESLDRNTKYDTIYRKYMQAKAIKLVSTCMIEASYYYHIKIPSESQAKQGTDYDYDVVIRFFPGDNDIKDQTHLRNYYIQFYSNSPSFIYNYAYLYNKNDYLIQTLFTKVGRETLTTPPTKTNPDGIASYDKSIYLACRYLYDNELGLLNKHSGFSANKVDSSTFFRNISSFNDVRMDQELLKAERTLKRTMEDAKTKPKPNQNRNAGKKDKNTGITNVQKKGTKIKISGSGRVAKKTSTKSTIKK